MSIYIPTYDRYDMLRKTVPRWLEQNILPVRLVVQPYQYEKHIALRDAEGWDGAVVVSLPPNNFGTGAARRFCVEHAVRSKLSEILMTDDDFRPSKGSDCSLLLEAAKFRGALGVTACRGLMDRSGLLSTISGVAIWHSGIGSPVYALNIANVLRCGNFDASMTFCEDAELVREGISRGLPWLVHRDVWVDSMNTKSSPGGAVSAFGSVEKRFADNTRCLRICEARWPKYQTMMPDGVRSRMAWAKMYDDYIPCWRSMSAQHGGSLIRTERSGR